MVGSVPVAVVIAAFSALVAVLSLSWGIWSWRMTGSSIRVHAFLYQEVLLIRAFNAGRTADTIEQLVLGARVAAPVGTISLNNSTDPYASRSASQHAGR